MAPDGLMISVSGVRGRVGESLTPEVVGGFAAAFGAWSLSRSASDVIVLGRDSRVSGPMFHRAVIAALQSVGAHTVDLGVVPTPTVQLEVEHRGAAGGLAITASHNPIEWNALKFIGAAGLFLTAAEGQAMRAFADAGVPRAEWNGLGDVVQDEGAIDRHIAAILALPQIDVPAIRARGFHVALDCVRGAGGPIMTRLLGELGCRVTAINLDADGLFPRPPEPVAENLGDLERLVAESGADVGLATDPDVDRLAIVDERGRAIGEDYTLALAAGVALKRQTGVVVTNLSTSRVVDDVVSAAGGRVIRAPVGEVNVASRMQTEGAVIGGEGNGGVILPDLHLGRDAPLAAAMTLQMLALEGRALSDVVAAYPRYVILKDKLNRPDAALDTVYKALRSAFADAEVDEQDGLRLSWSDRWVHVRPSGTEPIVRVIAEAPTIELARTLIARSRAPLDALAAQPTLTT
ncbi:MAG TPA: phosphoglucosamine mutase [Gemmatimonadaceae bacterium]|nr:phosphoglucosamine mutase [Gemmatimonadaceae bacterium]